MGSRLGGWSVQLAMAAGVEVGLLAGLGVWLWSMRPPARPEAVPRPVRVHWLAHLPRVPVPHPVAQSPGKVLPPPPLSLSTGPLLAQVVGVPLPRAGSLRLPGIRVAQGAGSGSPGRGIAVGFLIPSSGGLPATPYRVKQIHRGWCGFGRGPANSYVWLVGRVSRSGQVVSVTVLRTDTSRSQLEKSVESLRGNRFSPLLKDGHPTWFRIMEVCWWEPIPPALDPSWWVYCRTLERNHQMPAWFLYPLHGHHPLAVRVTYGPLAKDQPVPDIARAVAMALRLLTAGALPR